MKQEDGFNYEWEAVRFIGDDLTLECNFHLDCFPAILRSKSAEHVLSPGKILISGPELVQLMYELADRFNKKIVDKD